MSRRARKLAADYLVVAGAIGLLVSLFLTWSHQYPRSLRTLPGLPVGLTGVPRDASAWQVYSVADVLLAGLAVGLLVVVFTGFARGRVAAVIAMLIALAFTLHALSAPPSNGVDIVQPAAGPPRYVSSLARAGPGGTVAIVALAAALGGLALSAYPRSSDGRHPRRQATRSPG